MLFSSHALPAKLLPLAHVLHSLARERAKPVAAKPKEAKLAAPTPPAAKPKEAKLAAPTPPAAKPKEAKLAAPTPPAAKPSAKGKRAARRLVSSSAKPGQYDHLQPADFSALRGNAETMEDAPIANAEAASIATRILNNAERGRPLVTRSGGASIQVRRG